MISTVEAKKKPQAQAEPLKVLIRTCPMFNNTYAEKAKGYPIIKQKFRDFIMLKLKNPLEPYGSKDRGGVSGDPMREVMSNIKHAHLTPDISVFYAINGTNPKYIDLFGIFSHDDVGQGQPAKIKLQRQMADRLRTQIPQLSTTDLG